MANSNKTTRQQRALERMQGGTLSAGVIQRKFSAVKRRWLAETAQENATRQRAAKAFRQLSKPARTDPKQAPAIADLRNVTERLAKRKLVVPRRPIGLPDTFGNYTLRFTPPYTGLGTVSAGQISSVTGDPAIVATGDDSLGQMTCSVDTHFEKASAGTASNVMGVHFKPMFDHATARVTFDSQFAFSWYVNSIQNKRAASSAQGLIKLIEFDGTFIEPSLQRGAFIGWNESAENELDFNIFSSDGRTWALEAPVSANRFYFVVISLECSASGAGWPGSLAGARAVVTVPSISVHITGQPANQF